MRVAEIIHCFLGLEGTVADAQIDKVENQYRIQHYILRKEGGWRVCNFPINEQVQDTRHCWSDLNKLSLNS